MKEAGIWRKRVYGGGGGMKEAGIFIGKARKWGGGHALID